MVGPGSSVLVTDALSLSQQVPFPNHVPVAFAANAGPAATTTYATIAQDRLESIARKHVLSMVFRSSNECAGSRSAPFAPAARFAVHDPGQMSSPGDTPRWRSTGPVQTASTSVMRPAVMPSPERAT
jgi:hypothetical protein